MWSEVLKIRFPQNQNARLGRLEKRMRGYMKTVSTPKAKIIYLRMSFCSISTKKSRRIKLQKKKLELHIRKKKKQKFFYVELWNSLVRESEQFLLLKVYWKQHNKRFRNSPGFTLEKGNGLDFTEELFELQAYTISDW